MNDDELSRALQLFRESGRAWSEHWMERPPLGKPPAAPGRAWWAGAIAATVLAASVLMVPAPRRQGGERPFVPIPFVEPPALYERVAVARVNVPVAALVAAGFQMPAGDWAGVVEADVLLGQDGR